MLFQIILAQPLILVMAAIQDQLDLFICLQFSKEDL